MWPPPSHGDATNRWHIEGNTWRAAWAGEQRFWSIARKLHKAGIKSPAHLPVVASGEGTGGRARANILPKGLRSTQETDGRQHGRPLLMHTKSILSKKERTTLQGFLDLVDWKGQGVNLASRDRRGQHISAATSRPCRQCGGSEVPPGGVESQSGKDLNNMAWHLRGGLCLRCRPQTSTPSITTWMHAVAQAGVSPESPALTPTEVEEQLNKLLRIRPTAPVSAAGAVTADACWSRIRQAWACLLYTSPSPRDRQKSRMPSSA